jgi:hypothetical protein
MTQGSILQHMKLNNDAPNSARHKNEEGSLNAAPIGQSAVQKSMQ